MASLFDKNGRYTKEALALQNETEKVLQPIFEKYISEGFSVREIEYIINKAAFHVSVETLL